MALSAGTAAKISSAHRPVCFPPISSPVSLVARRTNWKCFCRAQKNYDYIPKQFRAENLPDGLMDNYKNVPELLYGLPREQLNMFTSKDGILNRQASKITPESLSSAGFYKNFCNMKDQNETKNKNDNLYNFKERINMYRGIGVPDEEPPDLPSILLDFRIVCLGMPLYEAVTKLIIGQLCFLNYNDSSKPIYLHICSTGTQDERLELVGTEAEAYAIADMMENIEAKVHTLNTGFANGQAAMLLSRGRKGHRLLMPNCETSLYMPKTFKSSGPTTDMWNKAKDLEANAEIFLELLSESTGKSRDEITKDIRYSKHFTPQEAIEYGLADRIIDPLVDEIADLTNKLERDAKNAMKEASVKARSSRGKVRPPGQFGR
ncbi:hypothetical protein LUZ60_008545 [Juncus effusus]|nr:hypothetical protein LUZ60_008545 [Juncus effusus]